MEAINIKLKAIGSCSPQNSVSPKLHESFTPEPLIPLKLSVRRVWGLIVEARSFVDP